MTSTVMSFAQKTNLEVKFLVKCKNLLGVRAQYGITSSKLEIVQ